MDSTLSSSREHLKGQRGNEADRMQNAEITDALAVVATLLLLHD